MDCAQLIWVHPQDTDDNAFRMVPPHLHRCCFSAVTTGVVSAVQPGTQDGQLGPSDTP